MGQQRRFLRARRAFTATGDQVVHDAVVQLDAERISGVFEASEVDFGPDDEVEDFGDATMLPGFVDAHVHVSLFGDGRSYEQMASDPDELMALVAVENLRRHLANGVTTVRDNGGRNRVPFLVREAIQRGYLTGPRMLVSGRPLTMTGGHFHWCNGTADGPDAIRRAIRKLVTEGADHIKIMASGGATRGLPQYVVGYSVEELRHAVETAHEHGKRTTAHALGSTSMDYAIRAGLDCLEHADFVVPPTEQSKAYGLPYDIEFDASLAQRLVESGTYVSFTIQAGGYQTLVRLRQHEQERELTDEEFRLKTRLRVRSEKKLDVFHRLLHAGMEPRLAVSTDAGPYVAQFGHFYLCLELAVEAGMTPEQAIIAATSIPARSCGVADRVGSLEPGKEADVVVVGGDPLGDIRCVRDVRAVYLAGHRLSFPDPITPGPLIPASPNV